MAAILKSGQTEYIMNGNREEDRSMQEVQEKENKNRWRDLLIVLLTAVLAGLGSVMPLFMLLFVLIELGLAEGGRVRFAAVLLVIWSGVQFLITGSGVLTGLTLMAILIVAGTVFLYRKHLLKHGHFNGVLAACASVAVSLGAAYGILTLLLHGDPIHVLSVQTEGVFASDTSEAGTELLRLFWQTNQVFLLSKTGTFTAQDAAMIVEKSLALTRPEMIAQTKGALEELLRILVPLMCVVYTAAGGLLTYVLSAALRAHPKSGPGRFLSMRNEPGRGLPPFSDWALPRDVGLALFGAVIVLFLLSFAGVPSVDTATNLVYTLFNIVFYVQGLATFHFLTGRWKWPKAVRIIVIVVFGIFMMPLVPTLGIIDYILRLRALIRFSGRMKTMTFVWPQETKGPEQDQDGERGEAKNTENPAEEAEDVPDAQEEEKEKENQGR